MIADRYHYSQLSNEEKTIYNLLYKGVVALEKEIRLPGHILTKEKVNRVFRAITDDNPHMYYLNQTHMNFAVTILGSVFMPQYFCTKEQIATYNARIEDCVNQIMASLDLQHCSELEKVKRVHDYMAQNIVYDHEALNTTQVNRLVAAHSIIGVFAKKRSVCEGIAKATKILLNTANVKCIVVSGMASLNQRGPHAWNIVKIGDKSYHLDVTWDIANTKNGLINYDYFNLPDEAISVDHFDFQNVPVCNSWDANYFCINQLFFKNTWSLERAILKGMKQGTRSFYFKMDNDRHSMADITIAMRNFILAELTKNEDHASVVASFNEEQRTARLTIEYFV